MNISNNKKKKNKNKPLSDKHGINKTALEINKNVKNALSRLATVVRELDDKNENIIISHWRDIPEDVNSSYKMFQDGAELIKATSTKYTLVGKISMEDGSKLAEDLQKGCELLATGALVLHQPSIGCARSTRSYAKRAACSVVASVSSLIDCFIDESAYAPGTIGAQKTGIVWSACDAVLRIPKGNRAAMRRDLLTWAVECNETMQEFEGLVKQTPSPDAPENETDNTNDDILWDDFCQGAGSGDTYQQQEIPVVEACLGLIRCSRGSINSVLQSCDGAGDCASSIGNIEQAQIIFQWINELHNNCRKIGEGMTDLGSLLYPPLEIESSGHHTNEGDSRLNEEENEGNQYGANLDDYGEIGSHILRQRDDVLTVIKMISECPDIVTLPQETIDLSNKLNLAVQKRCDEAKDCFIQLSDPLS